MVLLIVIITSFITAFMGSATNLAIPSIGAEFGAGAALLGWIATGYLLSTAAFTLPFGKLSDQIGKKPIFVIGILFFGVTSFLTTCSSSMEMLIVFRVLGGFFGAMIFSTNVAMLIDSVPPQKRGAYVGFSTAAVYTGLSVGPVLGGLLTHMFGWRSIFILSAIVGVIITIMSIRCLENIKPNKSATSHDFMGSFIYIIIVLAFLSSMSSFSTAGYAKYLAAASIILIFFFVAYEKRLVNPVLPINLLSTNRIFLFSNIAALIHYAATFGIGYLLSLYLQTILSLSSDYAGLILLSQPIMMAIFSPYAGTLSDKIEPRLLSSVGMGTTALGLFIFAFFTEIMPIWAIVANLLMIGIGFAFFSSPNTNAVMSSVPKNQTGTASSTLATMRNIGQALSMAVITLIISIHAGALSLSEIEPSILTTGLQRCFLIFSVAAVAGIFFSISRGTQHNDD